MSNQAAAKIIIENLHMFEEAVSLGFGEITENILNAIDELIKQNVEIIEILGEACIGEYNSYNGKYWSWFAPKALQIRHKESADIENFYAEYHIDFILNNDLSDNFWITPFFSIGHKKACFAFNIRYDKFKNKPQKKDWLNFARNCNELYPQIEKLGFQFDAKAGRWNLPFKLDIQSVAANYPDSIVDALTPITDSLSKIKEAHSYFVEIVDKAKELYGVPNLEDE